MKDYEAAHTEPRNPSPPVTPAILVSELRMLAVIIPLKQVPVSSKNAIPAVVPPARKLIPTIIPSIKIFLDPSPKVVPSKPLLIR